MKLLDLLTDPVRLPLVLALVAALARVVYAVVSRVVQPYPRARAALEAAVALLPDVLRSGLQLVAVVTGRPAPKLDALPADPRVEERAVRLAGSDLTLLRATVLDLQAERDALARRVAELTASEEPGRLRPTVVPGEEAPAGAVVTSRHRVIAGTLTLLALTGCPKLPPVSGCTPLSQRCERDRPQVCSPSRRWHTVGDEACGATPGQSCQVRAGVAGCAR